MGSNKEGSIFISRMDECLGEFVQLSGRARVHILRGLISLMDMSAWFVSLLRVGYHGVTKRDRFSFARM
jgi:hypothetical protein